MPSMRLSSFSTLICLSLVACSGSPSESDVRAAVSQQMQEQQKAQKATLGDSPVLDQAFAQQKKALDALKLIGCKADGEKAYHCDLQIGDKAISGRFVKGSNGWIVASD
ncbi:K+/H+ antiporter YhaU regulatory subunit KhtT [Robbsia andropogonis]|uniref:hypothetical protein n=1 Tax=Robbsia andropogonis TaxID=28092 RepID=UPI003D1C90DE